MLMIKQIAWNTFKNTGDINSYLELTKIENIEKKLENDIQMMEIEKTERIRNNLGENIGVDTISNKYKSIWKQIVH